ncbi:cyclic nucleotide-binding domain-containing protein [Streptomyces sp. M10(2022)]
MLAIRRAGELLGEQAALDGGPRSATLSALTRVEALMIPRPRSAPSPVPRPSWRSPFSRCSPSGCGRLTATAPLPDPMPYRPGSPPCCWNWARSTGGRTATDPFS